MNSFENQQKTENNSPNNANNDNNTLSPQPDKRNDYQILIGDNSFNPSTSQRYCQSTTSSIEYTKEYNKTYRNYISSPHLFFLLLFLVIYVLLILLGASVLSLFEQKTEFQIRDQILRTQQTFLAKHPGVDAESLDMFVESVIKALDSGVNLHQLNIIQKQKHHINANIPQSDISPTPENTGDNRYKRESKFSFKEKTERKVDKNENSLKSAEDSGVLAFSIPTEYSNWEFTSSLLFVTSVVTTIGYGHITPVTSEGKVFCLVFSCIAIPFTLVFLSIIVSLLKNGPIKVLEKLLIRSIRSHFQTIPDFFIRILHVLFVTLILLLLIIIIPALLFIYVENWSFLDAIYYCYISLTTVGLGDIVPASADPTQYESLEIYRICIIIYLYSGLALIMLWIAVILRIPQLNLKPFLLTEKEEREEMDEQSYIIDYNKDSHHKYGTDFSAQK